MKLTYISILRSLSILVVVFFHVYQYMYVPAHFPETVQMYHDTYFWINQCVGINVAMPMFTLIAGFLFSYLYDKGKYQEFVPLIKKKAMRLLLPFFVFGILMMATTGVPFRPWELYTGGFAHLWYLSFLFWCFPLGWFIKKYMKSVNVQVFMLVVFLLGASQEKFLPMIMGIHNISKWFGWFMLGMLLSSYQTKIKKVISKYHLVTLLLIPFLLQTYFSPLEYGDQTWYSVFCVASFLVGILYIFANMGRHILRLCQPLVWLSKYSFGIYIFHNWVGPYMISSTAKRIFPLEDLAANHIILFPFLLTLSVIFVSWCLSWALMQTKVGRMLIG